MPIVRSISGLRATFPDCLNDKLIESYAIALDSVIPAGKIIIGRDGRPSGEHIESVLISTLNTLGRETESCGIVPTPTVQLLTEHSDAVCGIAITASHNPSEWNGLKFINSYGTFFDKNENENLWNALDNHTNSKIDSNITQGNNNVIDNPIESHINYILKLPFLANKEIFNNLRTNNYNIVVDAVNASGSIAVPKLLNILGCKVSELYCDYTGIFPHTPEPLPENLQLLCDAVKEKGADLGIAVDPDADRLVLIDETGTPIGEEKTIALCTYSALHYYELFEGKYDKNIVVNLSTTRLVEDIANIFGANTFRSPVGEINVVNAMKNHNALIGGEGSGGVILPFIHYGRDSLVGIALVLSMMSQKNKSLSEICRDLPDYEMIKRKYTFNGELNELIVKLQQKFENSKINLEDGFRADFPDKWVQVRSSNTEPIIRIIAEAKTKNEAVELINIIEMEL